ncbi:hypothetical protein AK812_SmicGene19454 [Symbiodinium microadriaticum]|uniref:Pentatricopeptide repeat-containing protein, chloroplastic n=1 Tax=Symbiodinium microadriaticum TaxID=2951 RepID=A0A1Q9DSI3_SYMMI|nr:hypothetical protein AK812_SmicGene19454 [Symbiodinium microadriaticum]
MRRAVLMLFSEMSRSGVAATEISAAAVLAPLAQVSAWEAVLELHEILQQLGLLSNAAVFQFAIEALNRGAGRVRAAELSAGLETFAADVLRSSHRAPATE